MGGDNMARRWPDDIAAICEGRGLNYYLIRCADHSMAPAVRCGDPLLVDPRHPPQAGDLVYVRRADGGAAIRRLAGPAGPNAVAVVRLGRHAPPIETEHRRADLLFLHRVKPWHELLI